MPYNPLLHVLAPKAIGFSQASPSDARSYFFDETTEEYRLYSSTQEVIEYLDFPEYRIGHFPVWIDEGGEVLQFMFVNGTEDDDLIQVEAGGVKLFTSKATFPATGKDGLLYISIDDDAEYYWDGGTYVQLTSVHQYNNVAAFPAVGNVGFLYIDKSTTDAHYWNGTQYVALTGENEFVKNQNVVAQPANFWINGAGKMGLLSLIGANADPTAVNGYLAYRADLNKLRAVINGQWKNVATEDQLPAAGAFIQNQNAAAQNANFWINGTGRFGGPGIPGVVIDSIAAGVGAFMEFRTATRNQGYFMFAPSDNASQFRLQHTVGGIDFIITPGSLVYTGNDGSMSKIIIDKLWFGKGIASNPYTGGESIFMYDQQVDKYRMFIRTNGNWVIGSNVNLDNGAKFQIHEGVFSLASSATDYAVVNGGLFYDTSKQRPRIGINGQWWSLGIDGLQASGTVILVDQDNPFATDTRTGVSKYADAVPFRTIQAACAAAVNGDVVRVCRSKNPYVGDVDVTPGGWSGWNYAYLQLDNITINGNVSLGTQNSSQMHIVGINGTRSTINGTLSGGSNAPLIAVVNVNVRDGIWCYADQNTIIEDCDATWATILNPALAGKIKRCKFNFQAGWEAYGLNRDLKFTDCELTFTGYVIRYHQSAVTFSMDNCKLKIIGGSLMDDNRATGAKFYFRNCQISFTNYLLSELNTTTYIFAAHGCEFINSNPAGVIFGGGVPANPTVNHIELLTTVRNCATGTTPTVVANDAQVASIIEI